MELPNNSLMHGYFFQRFISDGSTSRKSGSGRKSHITAEISCFIDTCMENKDETSLEELRGGIFKQFGVLLKRYSNSIAQFLVL